MTTRLVDDLDGADAVSTVSFSLDGDSFEIDLSERHLAEFRAALEPFVTAARPVSGDDGPRRAAERDVPGAAEEAVSPGASGEGASVRGSRRRAPRRTGGGDPAPAREPLAVVPPATPASAPGRPAIVRPDVSPPQPQRKGRPLVADPFNQQVRIV